MATKKKRVYFGGRAQVERAVRRVGVATLAHKRQVAQFVALEAAGAHNLLAAHNNLFCVEKKKMSNETMRKQTNDFLAGKQLFGNHGCQTAKQVTTSVNDNSLKKKNENQNRRRETTKHNNNK